MFCGGKREKNENDVFGYKRESKFKIHIIFENSGRNCVRFYHYFSRQLTLKGSRVTSKFSLAFYTEKLKNDKIQFLVTKRVQNSKSI